jgi:archaellum component FlaC
MYDNPQLNELKKSMKTVEHDIGHISTAMVHTTNEISDIKDTLSTMSNHSTRISNVEVHQSSIRNQLISTTASVDTFNTSIENITHYLECNTKEITIIDKKIDNLDSRIQVLENLLTNTAYSLTALQDVVHSLPFWGCGFLAVKSEFCSHVSEAIKDVPQDAILLSTLKMETHILECQNTSSQSTSPSPNLEGETLPQSFGATPTLEEHTKSSPTPSL